MEFTSVDVQNMLNGNSLSQQLLARSIIPPQFPNGTALLQQPYCEISKAVFEKQPPANLRKSNFFNFVLTLYDSYNNRIEVERGVFSGFPNETQDIILQNGLLYLLDLVFSNGQRITQELLVQLINSQTREVICYEGQDKNPELRHVLLTHELICSRCCSNKSCGNKNETPSDCIIYNKHFVKFFMKCNQNCLKTPGNPKHIRRFQIAVSLKSTRKTVAISNNMFVHNNSKHGRGSKHAKTNKPFMKQETTHSPPVLKSLIPDEGWQHGGNQVVIIGENFFQGMQVIFGYCLVWSAEVFSSTALRVVVPPSHTAGVVEVCLAFNARPIFCGPPGYFLYNNMNSPSIEYGFQRLTKLLPKFPGDPDKVPKEVILKRAGDVMESLFTSSPQTLQVAPQSIPILVRNVDPNSITPSYQLAHNGGQNNSVSRVPSRLPPLLLNPIPSVTPSTSTNETQSTESCDKESTDQNDAKRIKLDEDLSNISAISRQTAVSSSTTSSKLVMSTDDLINSTCRSDDDILRRHIVVRSDDNDSVESPTKNFSKEEQLRAMRQSTPCDDLDYPHLSNLIYCSLPGVNISPQSYAEVGFAPIPS